MSVKGPVVPKAPVQTKKPPFTEDEIKVFKPFFIKLISNTITPEQIAMELGTQERYDRFTAYAKLASALIQKERAENELAKLGNKKAVLQQQLLDLKKQREESHQKNVRAIADEIGKIHVTNKKY